MTVSMGRIHTQNLKKIGQYLDSGTKRCLILLQVKAHFPRILASRVFEKIKFSPPFLNGLSYRRC
jgi:hypothetical protein